MAAVPAAVWVIQAVAAAVTAYSTIQAGKAQEAGYKAAANADIYNAKVAETNAAVARQTASAREEAQRRQARQILGEQRAALGQAGIGLSGSASDVYQSSAARAELDALNIRYEGEREATGLLAQAEQSKYEAKANLMNAKSARSGARLSAAAGLLSSAASAYGKG